MKKALAAILALLMLLAVVAVAEEEEEVSLVGVWHLVEMTMGDQTVNPADLGVDITMELLEDGTTLMLNPRPSEEAEQGTWTVGEDGTIAAVDGSRYAQSFTLVEGVLVADMGEAGSMTFSLEAPVATEEAA